MIANLTARPKGNFALALVLTVFVFLVCQPAFGQTKEYVQNDVSITVDTNKTVKKNPPGVVGWGAMWKRKMLWPSAPAQFSDEEHKQYIETLAKANKPLIKAADVRNISWPWGVSFSTYAVNWENSTAIWSKRKTDCVRLFKRTAPWCEKTVVGVGDLLTLAQAWELEAVTVSVPLAVVDGRRTRWGPGLFNHAFSPAVIEKVSDHAVALVAYMKSHPYWDKLDRVFLSAGCEWRHYGLRNPSVAVLTYADLIKKIRQKVKDKKVVIVASASDSTDIGGFKHKQAVSWNRYLYEKLSGVKGVALDLHRYRGMIGAQAQPKGAMPMTAKNIDCLLRTGLSQRKYLKVDPKQWGKDGSAMNSVLLENAIHGKNADHSKHSSAKRPWPVSLAHADLVRESLSSGTLTFLGWTWFPETLPVEWPHGAIDREGVLQPHARAQAFISKRHHGELIYAKLSSEKAVRANAVKNRDGEIHLYGGNFSRIPAHLTVTLSDDSLHGAEVEFLQASGESNSIWNVSVPLNVPPMTLFRIHFK